MAIPSGILRELYAVEAPTETRNAAGESVQAWQEIARVYGSYEAITFSESQRMAAIGGSTNAIVRIRYRTGVGANQRLRWVSREGRLLYISGVVERGNRDELELTVEEQA